MRVNQWLNFQLQLFSFHMSEFVTEQILGIRFFNGAVNQAVTQMCERGGLLVAPSGTCFERFCRDEAYRRAIISADVVLRIAASWCCSGA